MQGRGNTESKRLTPQATLSHKEDMINHENIIEIKFTYCFVSNTTIYIFNTCVALVKHTKPARCNVHYRNML